MKGLVVDKRKYKMAINEADKELRIQVHGLMREEDTESYMGDFQETIGKVNKNSYTLVIDGTYQTTVPSKVVPQLEQILTFYSTLGFKDVVVVKPSSKIAQVQLRNALERIDFEGTLVDSV